MNGTRSTALRLRNGLRKRIARGVLPMILHPQGEGLGLRKLGEGDGAWTVPATLIKSDWVCYCVGVGVNATFDVALTREFGCRVFSFDPTPVAIDYMKTLPHDPGLLTFVPEGIWNTDTDMKFFAPVDRRHVNHSVVDIHGTGDFFTAHCKRLSTVMRELGHDRLDLLKLDIEGSWREVIDDMIASGIRVSVLCAEFDSPTSLGKILRMTRALEAFGMRLVHFERENYVFVRRDLLPAQTSGQVG